MTSVTHKFKDESTSELPRDGFFFPLFYKNLPRITVFRKLKCPDPSMIPLPAEVRECQQKSIRLTSYILIYLIDLLCKRLILHANKEICCSFKSLPGGTFGYSYREDRRCISQVVPLRNCKKDISSYLGWSRNWSWSYFIASRHLQDAKRYRWFYSLPHS